MCKKYSDMQKCTRCFRMTVGELFSESKWQIIKDLSEKKLSPIQLAQKYNTTVGNVGHQLRLLEAYGLIKKEKTQNRDKGKPRTLFSLAYDCAYLVSASKGFAQKKLLRLSDYHDTIIKMWFIDDARFHYPLEKLYWTIEDHIEHINGIAVKINGENSMHILILTNNKSELKKKINSMIIIKNKNKDEIIFNIDFLAESELGKASHIGDYNIIYDPNSFLSCYRKSFESAN